MPYNLPVCPIGPEFERDSALADAKWVIDERGMQLEYYSRSENLVVRDRYNSLSRKTIIPPTITMNAFPVIYDPIIDQLLRAGLREMVDVLVYTAMQDWIDNNLNPFNDIDHERDSLKLQGKTYIIKEFGVVNQFSDTFLNVTFGLVLR